MGRQDTATASVGISISMKDAINAITEENYDFMRDFIFCEDSFIKDDNNYYTSTYYLIITGCCGTRDFAEIENFEDFSWQEYKNYMIKMTKLYGGESSNFPLKEYQEDDENNIYHQILLVPNCELIQTMRFGYDREGTNGTCELLNIDELHNYSKDIKEKMTKMGISKDKYDVCIILSQDVS